MRGIETDIRQMSRYTGNTPYNRRYALYDGSRGVSGSINFKSLNPSFIRNDDVYNTINKNKKKNRRFFGNSDNLDIVITGGIPPSFMVSERVLELIEGCVWTGNNEIPKGLLSPTYLMIGVMRSIIDANFTEGENSIEIRKTFPCSEHKGEMKSMQKKAKEKGLVRWGSSPGDVLEFRGGA